jgi:AraC-like DNA-binding protein
LECIWIFQHRATSEWQETIVADGLPELIVHLASPYKEWNADGHFQRQPSAIVSGQLTRPLILETPRDARMVGMRFKPGGLARFVSHRMDELTDRRLSAAELFPNVTQLIDLLKEGSSDAQRVRICETFLEHRLLETENRRKSGFASANANSATCAAINRVIAQILNSYGSVSVHDLAKQANISRRGLEIRFKQVVGVSPKQLCRIVRFRRVFDLLSDPASQSWIEIALKAGFFDQSHLIRDFQRFAGDSPASFVESTTPLAHSILDSS